MVLGGVLLYKWLLGRVLGRRYNEVDDSPLHMNVEILALCDAATTDASGKLSMLGSFDRVNARATPVIHPLCALAIKMRFERVEAGVKRVAVTFVDADGAAIMPPLNAEITIGAPADEGSVTSCLILNIQQLSLPKFGEYSIDLAVDGRHEASIPLFVKHVG